MSVIPDPAGREPAIAQSTMGQRYEYAVEQDWAGWFRSYGYDGHLEHRINVRARDGWRLIDTKVGIRACWYVIPRPKMIFIFERPID